MTARWLAESFEQGVLSARVGRDGDRLIAEWPERLALSVKPDGTDLVLEPHPAVVASDLEKLERGAVRLLLAHLAGAIPLHASAVAIDGRAVVFVGGTGLGKSTLAAALCDRIGASLLADDAVVIERHEGTYQVLALEPNHWLDAAASAALGRPAVSMVEKAPVPARRIDVARAPLAMIAHLAFPVGCESARLVPLLGLDAVAGLLSQLTRLVVDEPAVARRDLALLADLVDRTPIVRLERPRQLDLLWQTATLVAHAAHGDR
jgi:hypothetical protein